MDTDEDLAAATAARSVQVLTAISMMSENLIRAREYRAYRHADHDFARARTVRAEHQAQLGAARTVYGVTLDPDWSRRASVVDAAQVWRAAHDWAARDPEAGLAQRRAEAVLRRHSPTVMERYDTLCAQGVESLTAMREAAPLFIAVPATAASLTTANVARARKAAGHQQAADRAAAQVAPVIARQAYPPTPIDQRSARRTPATTPPQPPSAAATRRRRR